MKLQKGFTLIEVMITVVIIGLLAAVALPNYSEYVRRGKIAEATSTLANLRVQMEQFYQDNRTYLGGSCAPVPPGSVQYFTYACSVVPALSVYTIAATGVAAKGMGGFSYTIDQSNAKTSTVTAVPGWTGNATCWVTKQGGVC